MFEIFQFIIWCYLLHSNYAARHPVSPCPNVFSYEGEPENDRWYGVINFSSNIELAGLNYKVQLDKPSELLVSWDGEVRSDDNTLYNVFNPYHEQRPGEMVKARIMVKFSPESEPPKIIKIIINGNTMCSLFEGNSYGGSHSSGVGLPVDFSSTTERFDPSFNENEDTQPDYTNNRGTQTNSGNFGSNSNYGNSNPYGNPRPSNVPNNYGNSNQNFGNSNPSYGGSGTNYGTPNSGTYGNPVQPNYGSSDVNFLSNQPVSNYGGNRPQWQENSPVNSQNPSGINTGYPSNIYNPQVVEGSVQSGNPQNIGSNAQSGPNGPIVTTLTLPNTNQSKTNYDQILQIIKNQLDQQQFNPNANRTVIVAVVNSAVTANVATVNYPTPSSNIVLVTPEQPQQPQSQPKTQTVSTPASSTVPPTSTTTIKTRNTAVTNKSFLNNRN